MEVRRSWLRRELVGWAVEGWKRCVRKMVSVGWMMVLKGRRDEPRDPFTAAGEVLLAIRPAAVTGMDPREHLD